MKRENKVIEEEERFGRGGSRVGMILTVSRTVSTGWKPE